MRIKGGALFIHIYIVIRLHSHPLPRQYYLKRRIAANVCSTTPIRSNNAYSIGTPTKRQVSKHLASKRLASKRLASKRLASKRLASKRQVCKTSGLHNVRFTKRQVSKRLVSKRPVFKF
jgi:hypothetical protein